MSKGGKYYIQEHLHRKVFHGGIGNVDAEQILEQNGWQPILFPYHFDFSPKAKLRRLVYLIKTFLRIPAGSAVIFQFPLYARMHTILLRLLAFRKRIRIICFIADINGLKTGDVALLRQEIDELKRYRYFIVHNKAMEEWLLKQVPRAKTAKIEFFDFLTTISKTERRKENSVVFAGNLEKSGFINKMQGLGNNTRFYLYGPGFKGSQGNIVYKGIVEPYALPHIIEGAFGLVWDGEGVTGSEGALGSYMQFISHHKLSLYIASGLPVITASWAASAKLVQRYQIGFTVHSLLEIEKRIAAISEEEYVKMSANTRRLAERIVSGENLLQALKAF